MSKSGVFAHFGSREDLQIAVSTGISTCSSRTDVFDPAMEESRGLPRVAKPCFPTG